MIRHFTQTGLTSTSNSSFGPNVGYRWRIISILAWLVASTGTGTRSLAIGILPFQTQGGEVPTLTSTGSQTGTSATYFASLSGAAPPTNPAASAWVAHSPIYVDAATKVEIVPTIISGDTYGYDIQVIEEVDL